MQLQSLIIPAEMLRFRVKHDFICKFSSGLFSGLPRLSGSGISERRLFSGLHFLLALELVGEKSVIYTQNQKGLNFSGREQRVDFNRGNKLTLSMEEE